MASKHKNVSGFNIENLSIQVTKYIGTPTSVIIHSLLFIAIFALRLLGVPFADILLILTTAVSLEAIYLSIFIQMSINRNTESLEEVEEDIDEIQKDVDKIEEDVDDLQEDVEGIEDDVEDISKDIDVIQELPLVKPVTISHHDTIKKMESQLQLIVQELQSLKKKELTKGKKPIEEKKG